MKNVSHNSILIFAILLFINNCTQADFTTNDTGVELSQTSLQLTEGSSAVLTATVTPLGTPQKIEWTSDNPSVATVTKDGTVTAAGPGTTLIKAAFSNEKSVS